MLIRYFIGSQFILLSVGLYVSCAKQNSNSKSQDGSESTKGRENDKYSDDSEGVPGYLVNPEKKIKISHKEDTHERTVSVSAKSGAVENRFGKVSEVLVGFFSLPKNKFYNPQKDSNGQSFYKAKQVATTQVNDKGGFGEKFKIPLDHVLLVAVVAHEKSDTITVDKKENKFPKKAFLDFSHSESISVLNEAELQEDTNTQLASSTTARNTALHSMCYSVTADGFPYAQINEQKYYMGTFGQSCIQVCALYGGAVSEDLSPISASSADAIEMCNEVTAMMCLSNIGSITDSPGSGSPAAAGCTVNVNGSAIDVTFYHGSRTSNTVSSPDYAAFVSATMSLNLS